MSESLGDWLRVHDPGYGALRRAGRAAILMPALFALGDKVIGNPTISYFIAFGAFANLLLVDFQGTRMDRLRSQALMGVACIVLISVGTLVSQSAVAATMLMFIVAFVVLFSGVVSSVIASATTPLVLSFILPVTVPGPASEIPDRIAGWAIATVAAMVATRVLWPSPVAFPIESSAVTACRAIAGRLRAEIAWVTGDGGEQAERERDATRTLSDEAVQALDRLFLATPYRPTGLATKARAEIRLVDELRWLGAVIARSGLRRRPGMPDPSLCSVKLAAADVLERAATALDPGAASAADAIRELGAARGRLQEALGQLETRTTSLPLEQRRPGQDQPAAGIVSALDPSFRAQELAYITDQVATNVEYAAAAWRRSWWERLLGRQPSGFTGSLSSARERALAHAELSSSWLHNSLRGASGLALAVLVAELTSVQHGFWVVFGALAVLRSNALSTGQNVYRALVGTTVGFVIGGALVALIGTNTTVLWVILPFVVFCAGLAPSAVSFAAGQAAFTVTLLVLFNLLIPAGWQLGLVRIEDVAIGCAVSLVVGLLFWPRGASVDLGRALGRAYVDSSSYLTEAVAFGVACCDPTGAGATAPRSLGQQAAASARRLDDTFRGYLTERGAKKAQLAEVTALVTGVAGVRLAADAVLELWDGSGVPGGEREAARRELLSAAEHLGSWYDRFAASLAGAASVPDPQTADGEAGGRLVQAVATDLNDGDGHATATGVRVIWTGDHLDAVRRLQEGLVAPARAATAT